MAPIVAEIRRLAADLRKLAPDDADEMLAAVADTAGVDPTLLVDGGVGPSMGGAVDQAKEAQAASKGKEIAVQLEVAAPPNDVSAPPQKGQ